MGNYYYDIEHPVRLGYVSTCVRECPEGSLVVVVIAVGGTCSIEQFRRREKRVGERIRNEGCSSYLEGKLLKLLLSFYLG